MNNCIAIIQGRMSSSRLPGKVLQDIGGKPMLQHVIERVLLSKRIDKVVVATSKDPSDDQIQALCDSHSVACHRGSLHDVLDRFYGAAIAHNANIIVRVTADCPFVDPSLIDQTVALLDELIDGHHPDFAANRLPPPFHRTFPIGLDVEVCSMNALKMAWQNANELFHREHVMPYLYEETPLTHLPNGNQIGKSKHGFWVAVLNAVVDQGQQRWTVDTPEDLAFARTIYPFVNKLGSYNWTDLLKATQEHPEISGINAEIRHKAMKDVDVRAKK